MPEQLFGTGGSSSPEPAPVDGAAGRASCRWQGASGRRRADHGPRPCERPRKNGLGARSARRRGLAVSWRHLTRARREPKRTDAPTLRQREGRAGCCKRTSPRERGPAAHAESNRAALTARRRAA
eukprot:scaffold218_cov333-Prasinococcus_capsulatus_cf.AAC.13